MIKINENEMKKIFYLTLIAMTVCLASCNSCSNSNGENAQAGLVYSVNVNGDADGQFGVSFPNGQFDMNGDAGLGFVFSNDTTSTLRVANALTAAQIEENGDPEQLAALATVNSWVDETFKVVAASGTYYVHVQGYAKETLTGFVIAIDREFTNRADSTVVTPTTL